MMKSYKNYIALLLAIFAFSCCKYESSKYSGELIKIRLGMIEQKIYRQSIKVAELRRF